MVHICKALLNTVCKRVYELFIKFKLWAHQFQKWVAVSILLHRYNIGMVRLWADLCRLLLVIVCTSKPLGCTPCQNDSVVVIASVEPWSSALHHSMVTSVSSTGASSSLQSVAWHSLQKLFSGLYTILKLKAHVKLTVSWSLFLFGRSQLIRDISAEYSWELSFADCYLTQFAEMTAQAGDHQDCQLIFAIACHCPHKWVSGLDWVLVTVSILP